MRTRIQPTDVNVATMVVWIALAVLVALAPLVCAQTPLVVPSLVHFGGTLTDVESKP